MPKQELLACCYDNDYMVQSLQYYMQSFTSSSFIMTPCELYLGASCNTIGMGNNMQATCLSIARTMQQKGNAATQEEAGQTC